MGSRCYPPDHSVEIKGFLSKGLALVLLNTAPLPSHHCEQDRCAQSNREPAGPLELEACFTGTTGKKMAPQYGGHSHDQ